MTNKEAIYIINNRINTYYCTDEDLQALNLAIKALEIMQACEKKPNVCFDCEHCCSFEIAKDGAVIVKCNLGVGEECKEGLPEKRS